MLYPLSYGGDESSLFAGTAAASRSVVLADRHGVRAHLPGRCGSLRGCAAGHLVD
jgi:hypothetical protein